MTIYLAFFQSLGAHPIPAFDFWEYYVKNGIEESGHNWIESTVDWAEAHAIQDSATLREWKSRTWNTVIDDISAFQKKGKIDLFLSYFYPNHVDETAIRQIQSSGIPCVNFFCDHVREFKKLPAEFKVFDLNWVPELGAVSMYQQANLPYLHLPMPMWVDPKYRNVPEKERSSISFIGSKDVQRIWLLSEIKKHDLQVDIFGKGWAQEQQAAARQFTWRQRVKNQVDFVNDYGIRGLYRKIKQKVQPDIADGNEISEWFKSMPDFEEYINITRESMITIGINRFPSFRFPFRKPGLFSRLRDIEAPMLGACYLSEFTPDLAEFYQLGYEVESYQSVEEFVEKVQKLRADEQHRSDMRRKSQQRALNELSIPNSLKSIFQYFK